MNINESINTLQAISADLAKMPSRIVNAFHNPEAKEGVENIFTDMMIGETSYAANVKSIRTMTTVEDMLLNELRKKD